MRSADQQNLSFFSTERLISMLDEAKEQLMQHILDVTDPTSASHALIELFTCLHQNLIKGRFAPGFLRAVARPYHLHFQPVLGPSRDTLRELQDPEYAKRYVVMLRDLMTIKKKIDLHRLYPAEYNSYRSRKSASRQQHVYFDPMLWNFREWLIHLGPQPQKAWTVDRIKRDPKKGYRPGNIRWLSKHGQRFNQARVARSLVRLPDGSLASPSRLSQLTGLSRNTISQRLRRGWTVERILEEGPSLLEKWWFPPRLSFMVPEFRRRKNRGVTPLEWARGFAERMVHECRYDRDELEKANAVLTFLNQEWERTALAEYDRQKQLRDTFIACGAELMSPQQGSPQSASTASDPEATANPADEDWASKL